MQPWVTCLDDQSRNYTYLSSSYDASFIRENLGKSGIGVIYCHSNATQLYVAGAWAHDTIEVGSGSGDEGAHKYFVSNMPDLRRCHLLMLVGCHTADVPPGYSVAPLLNAFAGKGVQVVGGFAQGIDWPQARHWLAYFTKLIHYGDPNPPVGMSPTPEPGPATNLYTAARAAAWYAWNETGSYGGTLSCTFWLNDSVRPARWGQ